MSEFDFEQLKKDLLDGVSAAADSVSGVAKDAAGGLGRLKDFNRIGHDLFTSGVVTSHGGNLSLSDGEHIWITRVGVALGHIGPNDVVSVNWESSEIDAGASTELLVHRAIYHAEKERLETSNETFGQRAIIHAHCAQACFRSLMDNSIMPLDSEGIQVLGNSIPVLTPKQAVASEEVATLMAGLVSCGGRLAIVRGHGPFALGDSLDDAWRLISCLEYSSTILNLFEQTGRKLMR